MLAKCGACVNIVHRASRVHNSIEMSGFNLSPTVDSLDWHSGRKRL